MPLRPEQSDKETRGGQTARRAVPAADKSVRGPLTSAEITLIQRLAGRGDVSGAPGEDRHVHDAGCGHGSVADADPVTQSALLHSAMSSPSGPLSASLRTEAESFYQNDFSGARVHDNPVAQRATVALGAQAMTVGTHVFLGPGAAGKRDVMGHELSHVDKNIRGVRETGNDNGAGVGVTDPRQGSERTAAADGAAFADGAATAPSVDAPLGGAAPTDGAVQRATAQGAASGDVHSAVARIASRPPVGDSAVARLHALQERAGNGAVVQLLGAGLPPVQRMGNGKKEKSARQTAQEIDKEVKEKWGKAYGGGRHGNGPDEVRRRYARPMEDDRTSQTLSHQTFLAYDAIAAVQEEQGGKDNREREVQGMLVNNRLLFASNYNESMQSLKSYTTDGQEDAYATIVSKHQSDAGRRKGLPGPDGQEYVDRVDRADIKTQAVMAGQRGDGDATAEALQSRYGKPVALVDISNPALHMLLTSEQFEGSIFLLTFLEEPGLVHAEQKLLLALQRSGIKPKEVRGEHAIMGRYRGCLCCTAALEYYRSKKGFGSLQFDPNPGFYYWESLDNLYRHQAHVVNDPDFREYMMQLASQMPSTPALSRMEPPEDAYENHGPESIIDAGLAARRNYRSPSLSDMEFDYDEEGNQVFESFERDQDIAGTEIGAARIGKGSDQKGKRKSRVRAGRIINNADHRAHIQDTWLNGTSEEKTTLLKYWEQEQKASRAELVEIIGEVDKSRSDDAIQSAIYRYVKGRTGHENRDGRKAGDPVTRRPDKGKYAAKDSGASKKKSSKPARKSMDKESESWPTLLGQVKADETFYAEWRRREKGKSTSKIEPKIIPPALAQTISALSANYTVSSMARLLHLAERSLTRLVKAAEANHLPDGGAAEPEYFEDTPMEESQYDQASMGGTEYDDDAMGGTEYSSHSFYTGSAAGNAGFDIPDVGSSAGAQQAQEEFQGYTRNVDAWGQVTYIDNQTGSVSIWDEDVRRMVVIRDPVGSAMDWSGA